MKFTLYCGIALGCLLLANSAQAADWERELSTLREDVKVLQRQVYRDQDRTDRENSSVNGEVQGKISEYGDDIRRINGRLDELEHMLKVNDEKIEKFNRDMEIRLKILEGRPIPDELSAPAPKLPATYSAPVAQGAAAVVAGDKIMGDDLKPLDGDVEVAVQEAVEPIQPENSVPVAEASGVINANNPQTMYDNAMKAYNSGFIDEAELAFGDILKQFPQHALASNAQYWLGEIYMKQNNLNKAKVAFKDGYEKYKNGNKGADSFYRLGTVFSRMNDNAKACVVFMSFDDEFPKANPEVKQKVKAEKQKLGCK